MTYEISSRLWGVLLPISAQGNFGQIAYSGKPEIIKNDKEKLRELFL